MAREGTVLGGVGSGGRDRREDRSLLLRGRLRVRGVRIFLIGFMMAYDAPGGSAQLTMSGHVTSYAPDDGALHTTFGTGGWHKRERKRDCGGTSRCQDQFHGKPPSMFVRKSNALRAGSVPFVRVVRINLP